MPADGGDGARAPVTPHQSNRKHTHRPGSGKGSEHNGPRGHVGARRVRSAHDEASSSSAPSDARSPSPAQTPATEDYWHNRASNNTAADPTRWPSSVNNDGTEGRYSYPDNGNP